MSRYDRRRATRRRGALHYRSLRRVLGLHMLLRVAALAAAALLIGLQPSSPPAATDDVAAAAAPIVPPAPLETPDRIDMTKFTTTGPVSRFADPAILQAGSLYYAYATGSGNGRI